MNKLKEKVKDFSSWHMGDGSLIELITFALKSTRK